ncbi:hypothetical protein BIY24_11225 [Halobacteriovorax marinus]|uniref:Membrane protein n=1 Tax=Halobacteriovorax marinus (strain ATCC BAA-682 / DSM 15412 / SJ) TaxID=862908 RepID=E1X4W8_HALMS|nr:hypothetical protein [Halobacteriovorax marinus]ATH08500.1 hypothetical protein BIY24_11225 [Halobacteriovorax marinus]CBW27194.1 putative membrane protein [Halobacteriovorax marinus SJ]
MKIVSLLLILSLCTLGCSKEKITPAFGIETLEAQLEDNAVELSYDVDDINVDAFGTEVRGIGGDVGDILQRLIASFADIELQEGDGQYIELETMTYEFPELNEIDFNILKEVEFTGAEVRLIDTSEAVVEKVDANGEATTQEVVDLSFVQSLDVFLIVDKLPATITQVKPTYLDTENPNPIYDGKDSTILFSYKRDGKIDENCDFKCFRMKIDNGKVKDILKNNRTFSIDIRLKVDAVPKANLRLKTKFDFLIKINPGF